MKALMILGKAAFAIWLMAAVILYVVAFSHFIFPRADSTEARNQEQRLRLFINRLISASAWPIMAMSPGGRQHLLSIWKGR